MEEQELRINIIVSLQGALLGNISQHVRAICCDWQTSEWFKLRFYLDIEPDNIEKELMSIVLTEFESNLQAFGIQFKKYLEELIFTKEPFKALEHLRLVAYWRSELNVF
jgi:arginyl-tRNA synthetase